MNTATLLVRTVNSGFIKIEITGENIATSMAGFDEVPPEIEKAPVGSGRSTLNPFLINEARLLGRSYAAQLTTPVDYYVIKTGGPHIDWSEATDGQ